jgi:DNA-binding protein Fis
MTEYNRDTELSDTEIHLDMANRRLSCVMKEVEARYLSHVLTQAGGNNMRAADNAGLAYQTFRRKVQNYKVETVYRLK